jgi:hypothetical protein
LRKLSKNDIFHKCTYIENPFDFRFGEKMVEVKKENEKRSTVFIDRQGTSSQKIVRKPVTASTQVPSSIFKPKIQIWVNFGRPCDVKVLDF